jgi:predicted negative regulator of RcsB-dependent stress response
VTYAVLLAFVAMLAWEGFNKAKAASYSEAALVLDVVQMADGLAEPARGKLLDDMNRYTRAVIALEWPA